jgi:hypothetical protein
MIYHDDTKYIITRFMRLYLVGKEIKLSNVHPQDASQGPISIDHLTPWMIWKQHNECVFNGVHPSIPTIISRIKEEVALWARAVTRGIRIVVLMT